MMSETTTPKLNAGRIMRLFRISSLLAILLGLGSTVANATCTNCFHTITVSGNTNTNYTVTSHDRIICVSGNGRYRGTINANNFRVTVCVGPNVIFEQNAAIQNASGGANVINYGEFQGSNFNLQTGRTFQNFGTFNRNIDLNGGTIENSGTMEFSNININSGTIINSGSMEFNSSISPSNLTFVSSGSVLFDGDFNPNSGTYTFSGSVYIDGNFRPSSSTLTFAGPVTFDDDVQINSTATVNFTTNSITIRDDFRNDGTVRVPQEATSCVNICPSTGNDFINQGTMTTATGRSLNLCRTPTGGGQLQNGASVQATPSASGTSLTVSQAGNAVQGNFTAASPTPGGYLVLRKSSEFTTSDEPQFGLTYTVGSVIGGATVISILPSSTTTFTDNASSCATFFYRVHSVSNANSVCAAYRTASPAANTVVVQSRGGTAAGGRNVCSGDAAPTLAISGFSGNVVRWQSATNSTFTAGLTNIAHTGTTYTPPTTPSDTRFYRAEVQLGSCASAFASATSVGVLPTPTTTTWVGSADRSVTVCDNWDLGRPGTSTNATINGTTNAPRLNADLTINNLSFGSSNPSIASIDLNGRTLTVSGSLTLGTGSTLNFNNGTLILRGAISGTGLLAGGNAANLVLEGSSSYTLNFASGQATVNNLTINKSSGTVTLSSSVTVQGAFSQSAGSTLAIGTTTLTLNGTAAFAGTLSASTGTLSIGGSGTLGAFGGTLTFNTLGALTLNRTGQTLQFNSNLTVSGALALTAGVLKVGNGSTLNIRGAITTTSGQLAFAGAETLTIDNTGAFPASGLSFASGTNENILANLNVNRSGTLILSSNLTVTTALSITTAQVQLPANGTLTVQGNVTTASSGGIRGAATGSLAFTSTTAGPANLALVGDVQVLNFTFDKSGRSITQASNLTVLGTCSLSAGTFNMGSGHTLTWGGNVVIAGTLVGHANAHLTVNGSGSLPSTFPFTTTLELGNLTMARASSDLVISSGITINGAFDLAAGNYTLVANRTTTLRGNINICSTCQFNNNTTATLAIAGTGSINSPFRFNSAVRLGTLNVVRSNAVVQLGTNLSLLAGVTTLNGSYIDINGRALTTGFSSAASFRLAGSSTSDYTNSGTASTTVFFVSGATTVRNLTLSGTNGRTILNSNLSVAGNIASSNGAALSLNGNSLTVTGSITNGQLLGSPTSNLTVNVPSAACSLSFVSGARELNNLILTRNVNVQTHLVTPLTVNGTLNVTQGILNTNGNTITLATSATLAAETDNGYVRGRVASTRMVATGVAESFGNIGVTINALGNAPGATVVVRNTESEPTGNGRAGLRNVVSITPTINTGLNATLTMRYLTNTWVLNSNQSNTLLFWRSTDGGSTWQRRNFTARSTTDKTVTLSGINAFSDWALSDGNNPLPVSLTGFWGKVEGEQVKLNWATASEQNNAGFEIWAAASESVEAEWTKLGFVNGAGTTSSSQSYEWYGQMPETGTYFKLVQRDLDGTSKEVGRVFLNKDKASDIHANIYPNPTNGVVNFTYHALSDAQGHLVITDAVGRVVKTMDTDLMRGSGAQVIDLSAEPAGVYLINLTVDTEGKKQQWKLLKQ